MNKLLLLLAFAVLLLAPVGMHDAFAGGPAVSLQCGDMIGSTSSTNGLSPSTNGGAIVLISQIDASQTLIGDPTVTGSISGLDFDGAGMLWGVNNIATGVGNPPTSDLIKINPNTGALISTVPITAVTGAPVSIQDLGVQPGTDVLFGTTHILDTGIGQNNLVTIDKSTGIATLVGNLGTGFANINALDFAPDGTLYVTDENSDSITTVNPIDASQLTSVVMNFRPTALGVRADGVVFINGQNGGAFSEIYTVNPDDGTRLFIGDGIVDQITDLTFVECAVVGGEILSIDSTALVLAGAQSFSWMIPVLLSGLGIGLFVFTKSKNS